MAASVAQRRARAARPTAPTGRSPSGRSPRCGSPTTPTRGRAPSPAARRNGFPLPGHWFGSRTCCCSTSRSARWTRSPGSPCTARRRPVGAHRPSVLLVTHDVDEALLLADRVLILDGGAIVAEHELTQPATAPARRPPRRAGPGADRSRSDRSCVCVRPSSLVAAARRWPPAALGTAAEGVRAGAGERRRARQGDVEGRRPEGRLEVAATAAGLLDDLPYKIEWATFTSGPPLLEAVSAGGVHIGRVGNTPPIFAAAANAKIAARVQLAGQRGERRHPRAVRLAAEVGEGPARQDDRRRQGQLRARPGAATPCAKAGLSTKDVKLSFLQPADAYGAFNQHQIDAWAVWDPYTSQAKLESERAGARRRPRHRERLHLHRRRHRRAVRPRRQLARSGTTCCGTPKAERWADTHREEWAQAWAKETGLAIEVAARRGRGRPGPAGALDDKVVTVRAGARGRVHRGRRAARQRRLREVRGPPLRQRHRRKG